ncbi:MAG: CBS domain-containing protein [Streptosporangiales bacterium]|nr:CBS domain-containing protein [Streptosporangiales bacterium]
MKHTHVSDVMTTNVVTVHVDTPFKDVVETLARHNISGVPVLDDDRHVVGVVSEADLLPKEERKDLYYDDHAQSAFRGRRHRSERRKAEGDTAGELMNTPALTTSPHHNLAGAARLLARHKIKRLPVVDEQNRLVGVVSRFDLLIPFLRSDDDIRDEVVNEVVVKTLWESPRNVHVDVEDGVVTLSGQVELDTIIPVAASLALAVDGVVDVVNELTYARKAEKYPASSSIPW